MSSATMYRGGHVIRSSTHKQAPHYECRVVRSVAPNQPELSDALGALERHTGNFVNYKEMGKLGVTLVMLEPVLRQIMGTNRKGAISREELTAFERDLNDSVSHSQYADYDIPVHDSLSPLSLYGKNKQHLAIRLAERDYRLVGDRAVIEQYIKDRYDVGKRFLEKNLVRMSPHVTIGQVRYENLEPRERESIQDDPTSFVIRRAYDSMQASEEQYGLTAERRQIIFPEQVTLNGLRIFCQAKP